MVLWAQIMMWSSIQEPGVRDLDSLELFSGAMQITRAMQQYGLNSVGYDKKYHKGDIEDLTSDQGFSRAMSLVLRLKIGGSLWAAPVCSSWTFIGRSSTKRTASRPEGDGFNMRVRNANRMVMLLTMLFLLAVSRGVHCWLEQPAQRSCTNSRS